MELSGNKMWGFFLELVKAFYWPKTKGIFLSLEKFHVPTYLTYRTIALRWALVTMISQKMGRLSCQVLSQTYKLISQELYVNTSKEIQVMY